MSYLFVLAFAAMATYGAAVKQHPSVVYALNAGGAELVNNGVVYASDLDAVSTASPVSLRCTRRREGGEEEEEEGCEMGAAPLVYTHLTFFGPCPRVLYS